MKGIFENSKVFEGRALDRMSGFISSCFLDSGD